MSATKDTSDLDRRAITRLLELSKTNKKTIDRMKGVMDAVKMLAFSAANNVKTASEGISEIAKKSDGNFDKTGVNKHLTSLNQEVRNLIAIYNTLEKEISTIDGKESGNSSTQSPTAIAVERGKCGIKATPSKGKSAQYKASKMSRNEAAKKNAQKKATAKSQVIHVNNATGSEQDKAVASITGESPSGQTIFVVTPSGGLSPAQVVNTPNSSQKITLPKSPPKSKPYVSREYVESHRKRVEEAKRRKELLLQRMEAEGKIKRRKTSKSSPDKPKKSKKKQQQDEAQAATTETSTIPTVQYVALQNVQNGGRGDGAEVSYANAATLQIVEGNGQTQILCRTEEGTYVPANWTLGSNGQWQATPDYSQGIYYAAS